jgi:hypothetical protein
MDTSPEYLLMCEKAYPVLGTRRPQSWDWWCMVSISRCDEVRHEPEVLCISEYETDGGLYGPSVESLTGYELLYPVWRQDQLQEMVGWKDMRLIIEWRSVTHRFEWWADNPFSITTLDYRAKVESLEQAWLHLVMYRKYGKRWSGKGWVDAAP